MENDTIQCGVITTAAPYAINYVNKKDCNIEILGYKGTYFQTHNCPPDLAQEIRNMVNSAYQRGFADCGADLMPRIMKFENQTNTNKET